MKAIMIILIVLLFSGCSKTFDFDGFDPTTTTVKWIFKDKKMKWNKKFEYPETYREMIKGQRHYSINDEKLPSVTTILSKTQTAEKG